MGAVLAAAVAMACLVTSSIAHAQVGGSQDAVVLPSGGFVRGVVVEYDPPRRVVIRLPSGEVRTFVEGEYQYVQIGEAATSPPPAPTPIATTGMQVTTTAPTGAASQPPPAARPEAPHAPDPPAVPAGRVHAGLRIGGGVDEDSAAAAPIASVDIFGELLFSQSDRVRLRAMLSTSFSGMRGQQYPRGDLCEIAPAREPLCYGTASGGLSFALRVLAIFDITRWLFASIGPELSLALVNVSFVDNGDYTRPVVGGGGVIELGGRAVDGHLELGIALSIGSGQTVDLTVRHATGEVDYEKDHGFVARAWGFVGWTF